MSSNKSSGNKISKQLLASILAVAGIYGTAHAADCTPVAEMDNVTSEKIIRVLVGNEQIDLDAILSAYSIEDLTPEQRAGLLKLVQKAADNIKLRQAPWA